MKAVHSSEKPSIQLDISAEYQDRLFGHIDNLSEFQLVLRILFMVQHQSGFPRFVTRKQIEQDPLLTRLFGRKVTDTSGEINSVLDRSVRNGHLTKILVESTHGEQELVLLSVVENHEFIRRSDQREVNLSGLGRVRIIAETLPVVQDVFSMYEENIGIITPIVADELKDAETNYPYEFIADAIKEAAERNKRSWRYVAAILRSWAQEGRQSGSDWRRAEKVPVAKVFKEPKGPLLSR
jgi:DNA replication protein